MRRVLLLLLWCALLAAPARAQQPFVVDDAGVTPSGVWHVEVSSQTEALRPSARPARWQHIFEWEVDGALTDRLELGAIAPLITLMSDRAGAPGRAAKYRFTRDSAAPTSWAASATIEWPTGSRHRGLGSGLVDYGVALIAEHRRVQAGAELTGAWSQKTVLVGSTVGGQTGANVALRDGVTLDLGLLGGWYESSPRLGAQVGTSIDWRR